MSLFPLNSLDDLTLDGLRSLQQWVNEKIEEVEEEECKEEEEQNEI